jgi:purine-binding chemotaxis protein CheW
MAVEQFCTFYLNDTRFGMNIKDIQEIIRHQIPIRVPLANPEICGLINLRGQIVTVLDLKQRLKIGEESDEDHSIEYNIVVHSRDDVVSLQIDRLDDILELSRDQFEPPPATLQGTLRQFLQGAYKLADGFLLVLDPDKVLDH